MPTPSVSAIISLIGSSAFKSAVAGAVTSFNALGTAAQKSGRTIESAYNTVGRSVDSTTNLIIGASAAASAALFGLASASVVMGAEFVQQMENAQAATSSTNAEMDKAGSAAIALGRKWTIPIQEVAKGTGIFIRAGATIDDITNGAYEQILALTIASNKELTLENAIMMTTGMMTLYNIKGAEAARITNAMTAAANTSAITFKDIYRAVPQLSAVYQSLGYTVEDVYASVGMLGQQYIRNSDAGTSLKTFLMSLMNDEKKAAIIQKEYGISLFDSTGKAYPFVVVLDQMHKAFGQLDENISDEKLSQMVKMNAMVSLFGSDATRAAIALAKNGPEALAKYKQIIAETSTLDMAGKMIKPAASQFLVLRNNAEAFGIVIGKEVEPAVRGLLSTLNGLFATVTEDQMKLVGKSLMAGFTGVGFDALRAEADKLLSGGIKDVFKSWIDLLEQVRNSLMQQVIPSFLYLFNAISGGASATNVLSTILSSIATSFKTISNIITVINILLGDFISWLKQSTVGALLLQVILKGLLALPFVAMLAVFIKLGMLIGALSAPVLIAALAIGALIVAFENLDKVGAIIQSVISWFGILITAVGTAFSTIGQLIAAAFSPAIEIVSSVSRTVMQIIASTITFISQNFERIASFIVSILVLLTAATIRHLTLQAAAWVGSLVPAIALTLKSIAIFVSSSLALLAIWAAQSIRSFIIFATNMVLIVATNGLGVTLRAIALFTTLSVKYFAIWAAQSIAYAIRFAAMFVSIVAASVISAASAIIAALIPIIGTVALVAGVAALLYMAWKENWLGIQGIVQSVVKWISDRLSQFITWLQSLPLIGGFVQGVATTIGDASTIVTGAVKNIGTEINNLITDASKGFPELQKKLGLVMPSMEEFEAKLKAIEAAGLDQEDAAKKQADAIAAFEAEMAKVGAAGAPGFMPDDKELSKGDKLKEIVNSIMRALSDLPIMTRDLAEFLADIAQDAPARLVPMIAAIKLQKNLLKEIVELKKQILNIDLSIVQIENQIALYEANIAAIDAKIAYAQAQRAEELIRLRTQVAAIDIQTAPARARIAEIDAEINRLNRENLQLKLQVAKIDVELIPYKKQLLILDQQIADTEWKNFYAMNMLAQAELNILPAKQKIAEIDQKITQLGDKRLQLLREEQDLIAKHNVSLIDRQLKTANVALEDAWQRMDVAAILAGEAQVANLEDQKTAAETTAEQIQYQIEDEKYLQDLAKNRLEQEKAVYEESIESAQQFILYLNNQIDLYDQINEARRVGYEAERQSIEQTIKPLQDKLALLNFEIEAEKTRNQVAVIGLEIEKQALEDSIAPLLARRQIIQDTIDLINNQLIIQTEAFEIEKAQFEEQVAEQNVYKTALELTKAQITETYNELIMQFVNSLVASRAFTTEEAFEVAKRLTIWTDQVNKLSEIYIQFSHITSEARNTAAAINAIPKDVTITITTVHRDIYESSGSTGRQIAMQFGGIVPGPIGQPVPIIAHGGEYFLGVGKTPSSVAAAQSRPITNNSVNTYNTNYNVNAAYGNVQTPGNIAMDLRALALKTRR